MEEIDFKHLGRIREQLAYDSAEIVLDQNGVIQKWTDGPQTIMGWTADEVMGRSLAEVAIPEHLRARHNEGIQRWSGGNGGTVVCHRLRVPALHKDGYTLMIEVQVQVLPSLSELRFYGWVYPVGEHG